MNEKNGIIVNQSLSNLNVSDLYEKQLKFKYTPKKDTWEEHLIPNESTYLKEASKTFLVEALDTYTQNNIYDATRGKIPEAGETWEVDYARLLTLLGENDKELIYVKVLKEIPKE